MVGNCLVALGRTAEAYEEMAATLREVEQRAGSDPKYAPTRDAAATQLALLEPKVGKIVVNLEGQHARITMNGVEIPQERLGSPVAVLPGAVVIVATAPDGRSSRKVQDVRAGETAQVTIAIEEAPQQRPSTQVEKAIPDPPPDSPKVTPSGGGVRTAGFVVAGLGVAGLAVFGVAGSMARGKFSTLEEECGGTRCTDPKYGDVVDSGKTLATVGLRTPAASRRSGWLHSFLHERGGARVYACLVEAAGARAAWRRRSRCSWGAPSRSARSCRRAASTGTATIRG
jgi:hypothetical protein